MKLQMGQSYKLCRKCLGPIVTNGVQVKIKKGRQWQNLGYFHNHCFKEISNRKNSKYYEIQNKRSR